MAKIFGLMLLGLATLFAVTGLGFTYCAIMSIGPQYMADLAFMHGLLTLVTGLVGAFLVTEF